MLSGGRYLIRPPNKSTSFRVTVMVELMSFDCSTYVTVLIIIIHTIDHSSSIGLIPKHFLWWLSDYYTLVARVKF